MNIYYVPGTVLATVCLHCHPVDVFYNYKVFWACKVIKIIIDSAVLVYMTILEKIVNLTLD